MGAMGGFVALVLGSQQARAAFPLPAPQRPSEGGRVVAWGTGPTGQLDLPESIRTGNNVVAVHGGEGPSNVALLRDGTVVSWGGVNEWGEKNVPAGLTDVASVAASYTFGTALKTDGTVVTWGEARMAAPAGLRDVAAISGGHLHALALKRDGTVVGWGYPPGGLNIPAGLSGVVAVAAGYQVNIALKEDGTAVAWGTAGPDLPLPAEFTGLIAVAAGSHTLAGLKADGTVVLWGTSESQADEAPAGLLQDVVALDVNQHGLALRRDGTVVGWGNDLAGKTTVPPGTPYVLAVSAGVGASYLLVRDGPAGFPLPAPVRPAIPGRVVAWGNAGAYELPEELRESRDIVAISAGWTHALALRQDGTVVGWGPGLYGSAAVPAGLSNVVAISAGTDLSFALKEDGTVAVWGAAGSPFGQVPAGLTNIAVIAAGNLHSMALQRDGTVVAWGDNSTHLVEVPAGLSNVVAISAGMGLSAARRVDGTVALWGENPLYHPSDHPAAGTLSGIVSMQAGAFHYAAVHSDRTLRVWGASDYGLTNVPPGLLTNVVDVALSVAAGLVLRPDRTLAAWGGDAGATAVPAGLEGVLAMDLGAGFGLALVSDEAAPLLPPVLYTPVRGGGRVVRTPDLPEYPAGAEVLLKAEPGLLSGFAGWADGVLWASRIVIIGATNVYEAVFTNSVPVERVFVKEWELDVGTAGDERAGAVVPLAGGGWLIAGTAPSPAGGNKSATGSGSEDFWLLEVDAAGGALAESMLGGTEQERLAALVASGDGGWLAAGSSASPTGRVKLAALHGGEDYWIVRLGADGSKLWDRSFGGTSTEGLGAVSRAADGGYFLAGYSLSGAGGTKTSAGFGNADAWVVRVDGEGVESWQAALGGDGWDEALAVAATAGGGCLVMGHSQSGTDGSKVSPRWGMTDYWVVQLDALGRVTWDRSFGGASINTLGAGAVLADRGFLLGGTSSSGVSGNKTVPLWGSFDAWLVRGTPDGTAAWQQALGGVDFEDVRAMTELAGGRFLLAGAADGGASGNRTAASWGKTDFWLAGLDWRGEPLGDACFGGTEDDEAQAMAVDASGGILLAGGTRSGASGGKYTSNQGGQDLWAVKVREIEQRAGTPVILVDGVYLPTGERSYTNAQPVRITITSSFPGANLFYTLDGSAPDAGSVPWPGALVVTPPAVLRAVAYDAAFTAEVRSEPVRLIHVPRFPLVARSAGGGGVQGPAEPGPYLSNTVVTLTATNLPGWTFLRWEGDLGGTEPVATVRMDGPKTVEAVFGTTLTASTLGGGSVVLEPPAILRAYGSVVRAGAVPGTGQYFKTWGGMAAGQTANPLELVITNPGPSLVAVFAALATNQCTLTLTTNGPGRVRAEPAANVYTVGQTLTLTAEPLPGYRFTGWTGALGGASNPATFVLGASSTVGAGFEAAPPELVLQPADWLVSEGEAVTLRVGATGLAPMTYAWFKDDEPVPGATSDTLAWSNAPTTVTGIYFARATNPGGVSETWRVRVDVLQPGQEFWRYGPVASAMPAVGEDGQVHVFVPGGIEALSPYGQHRWRFADAEARPYEPAPAVGRDGTVVYGTTSGLVHVLDGLSGAEKWSYQASAAVAGAVAIIPEGALYFVDADGRLYSINPATHNTNWTQLTADAQKGAFGHHAPSVGPDGTIYYFDGKLHAVAPADGRVKWTRESRMGGGMAVPVVNAAGVVYVPALPLGMAAIRADGGPVWTTIAAGVMYGPPVISGDGRLLSITTLGSLRRVGSDGAAAGDPIELGLGVSSPAVDAAGNILVGTLANEQSYVAALRPDGTTLWRSDQPESVSTSPVLDLRGVVYVVSATGVLKAIWHGVPPETRTWSMMHGDSRNSGVTPGGGLPLNEPPQVVLDVPLNGSVLQAPVTLSATATDADGTVVRVDFHRGDALLAEVTGAGPVFTWVWTNAPTGGHLLTARAIDNRGAVTVSDAVVVTVQEAPPAAVFRFETARVEVGEAAGTVNLVVRKDEAVAGEVGFQTVAVTAEPGRDFVPAAGTIGFGVTETQRVVTVRLLNDYVADGTRRFEVTLVGPSAGHVLGTPRTVSVEVRDDDAALAGTSLLELRVPGARPAETGQLQVYLEPGVAQGQWRLPWEVVWHASGDVLTDLEPGNYRVEFKPVAQYREPPPALYAVPKGETVRRTLSYQPDAARPSGSLRVDLEPRDLLATAGLVPGWRLRGETAYRADGAVLGPLPAGLQIVEFKPLAGWSAPAAREVRVLMNLENRVAVSYLLAPPPPVQVATPAPVRSYAAIRNALAATLRRPLALNGQLRSAAGWGSGIAVREKVVLTAAHVLFDEATQDYVSGVDWFHERHAGEYEPRPLRARGWYVFGQYLEERRRERAAGHPPGESTVASQQWDVAALYFDEPAARGGASGYLMSDAAENEWLVDTRERFLSGYPLSGLADGRLHETPAEAYLFAGMGGAVYTTAEVVSYPGNSGGPLCVLHPATATYYPAAVYLGSTGDRSIVRTIDRQVVELISRAASSADLGTNFGGGGVINFSTGGELDPFALQTLTVRLEPEGALAAGAAWRVKEHVTMAFTNAVEAAVQLVAGETYTVEFREAAGYVTPLAQEVTLAAAQDATLTVRYEPPVVEVPVLWGTAGEGIFVSGTAGRRVVIERRAALGDQEEWAAAGTVTLGAGPERIAGPPWTGAAGFYRARFEP